MSIQANTKHYSALLLISLGVMSLLGVVVGIAVAVAGKPIAGVVCALVGGVPGWFLIRSGFRVRSRALAAGSTVHIGEDADVHTTVTRSAKPSFLKDKRPPRRDNDF